MPEANAYMGTFDIDKTVLENTQGTFLPVVQNYYMFLFLLCQTKQFLYRLKTNEKY